MPFAPVIEKDADLAKVRGHLTDAATYALELRSRPADKRDDAWKDDMRSAVDFIHEFAVIETGLEARGRADTAKAEEAERAAAKLKGGRGNSADLGGPEFRSLGQQVVEAEGYEEWRSSGGRQSNGAFSHEARTLIGSYSSGAFDTNSDAWLAVNSRALQTPSLQRRRPFLRDLIGVQPTGLASFAYMRETTPVTFETGAATTSEGSAKAEVTMLFTPADAPARKITAWIPVTDEMLQDAPTLRGYIDARLEYMLMIREEAQVYNGDGTAPNLQGLKTVTGVQTQAAIAGDFPATIAACIGKIENVDGDADGVAANPIDYWVAVAKRYSTHFDNGYGGNAPAGVESITWGLTCVRTRAIASGDAMVAAWRMGATIFQRQGLAVKVGDQHSDNFVKNILVVLAEERIALPIWRPDFFVDSDVPTS